MAVALVEAAVGKRPLWYIVIEPPKARSSQVEANLTAALAAEAYKDGRVRLARNS